MLSQGFPSFLKWEKGSLGHWFGWCMIRSCTFYNRHKFTRVVLQPEDTASFYYLSPVPLKFFLMPLPQRSLSFGRRVCGIYVYLEESMPHPYFCTMARVFVLIITYYKQTSLLRAENALIHGHNNKWIGVGLILCPFSINSS